VAARIFIAMAGNSTFSVLLSRLAPWNPFESSVWCGISCPITKDEVCAALEGGVVERVPHSDFEVHSRDFHIARVAYFVLNGWESPIEIDVGCPSLGCYAGWIVNDGNHRLAAAFYLGLSEIQAEISGSWDYAAELLGVDFREETARLSGLLV